MSVNFQLRLDQELRDINPLLAGECCLQKGQRSYLPPAEYYLIHYVRCGSGTLRIKGRSYNVRSGQIFLILPGEAASFQASFKDPWALRWVGFNGALAHRFAELDPVSDAPEGTFLQICSLKDPGVILEYKLAAEILFLQAMLLKPQKQKIRTDYSQWIMEYVQEFYMNPISVAGLAAELGLDSSYLSRKFRLDTNMTIQNYIMQTRVTSAKHYLVQGYSVKETAGLCGFNDPSGFCKTFKKYDEEQRSPARWQQIMLKFL